MHVIPVLWSGGVGGSGGERVKKGEREGKSKTIFGLNFLHKRCVLAPFPCEIGAMLKIKYS